MDKRQPSVFIEPATLEDYLEFCQQKKEDGERFVTLPVHQISSLITAYLNLLRKQGK
ncbi:hypothetical protein NSS79_19255 [Paenibacillus sp. FSL L8-0436]|uniref:hypothetical protein n=1 Tax=Paenibacillus sp. FSL L8-0436 TaxID=2954686 RepID=UPI0031581D56